MRKGLIVLAVTVATTGVFVGGLFGRLGKEDVLWVFAWILWAPVGGLILWKRPGNPIGATTLSIGLSAGIGFWLVPTMYWDLSAGVLAWLELFNTLFGVLPFLGIVWLLLIFPSGSLPGPLDKTIGRVLTLFAIYAVFGFLVNPTPMEVTGLSSPLALDALAPFTDWIVSDAGFVVVVVLVVTILVSLAMRWLRSEGMERRQFRAFLFGTGFFGVVLVVGQLVPDDSDFLLVWVLSGGAIPVAIAVAALKYRLYEIDRIISRTVSYGIVVGLLAVVFSTGVVWIPNLVPGLGDSSVLVAVSTLVVAAMFNPLRRRVQEAVDRRFNRSRYDAERVMEGFTGSLQNRLDSEGLVVGWVGVVSDTMQPSTVAVWTR